MKPSSLSPACRHREQQDRCNSWDSFDGGGTLLGGTVFRFLHEGPMSFAICRTTHYCHANVAQLWSSV